jgi:hypothetical protein
MVCLRNISVDTLHKGDAKDDDDDDDDNNNNNNNNNNTEVQLMLNLKCTIIPVTIGATLIVSRSLRKNLEDIPRKHSMDLLQKTAILETSHIIGEYCSVKLEA